MAEEAAAKPFSTRTSTYWNGDLIFGGKCTIENVSFIKPHSLKNILLNNNINVDNNSQSLLKLGEEAGDFHDSEFLRHGLLSSTKLELSQIIPYDSLQSSLCTLGMQCAYVFELEMNNTPTTITTNNNNNNNSKKNNDNSNDNNASINFDDINDNVKFINTWHNRRLCPIFSGQFKFEKSPSTSITDVYVVLIPSDSNKNTINNEKNHPKTYAILLESPGLLQQELRHNASSMLNSLLTDHLQALMKKNVSEKSYGINLNKGMIAKLKEIDNNSNDNLYSLILEQELNIMFKAMKAEDFDMNPTESITSRWTRYIENIRNLVKDGMKQYLGDANSITKISGDNKNGIDIGKEVDNIRNHISKCMKNSFKLSSKDTRILMEMNNGKRNINNNINADRMDDNNNKSNTSNTNMHNTVLKSSVNVSGISDTKKKQISNISTGKKKQNTSKAQAALAGATERDRVRRRERRKRGGVKKNLINNQKFIKNSSYKNKNNGNSNSINNVRNTTTTTTNSTTTTTTTSNNNNNNINNVKLLQNSRSIIMKKRKSITSPMLQNKKMNSKQIIRRNSNSKRLKNNSQIGSVSTIRSYKTLNEKNIQKACKSVLNSTKSPQLQDKDIYNQILSFAFKSTVLTIKAKEKNGIDGEINVEKLNGIAIKNCKHAMMMLLQ